MLFAQKYSYFLPREKSNIFTFKKSKNSINPPEEEFHSEYELQPLFKTKEGSDTTGILTPMTLNDKIKPIVSTSSNPILK